MHDMQYITRHDQGSIRGWIVRIDQGKPTAITKKFDDRIYGGTDQALRAAQIYRDQRLQERGSTRLVIWRKSKRNRSGFIGISRIVKVHDHAIYVRWRAIYSQNGSQHEKSFPVSSYGECGAFRKACQVRYEMTGELRQVLPIPNIPRDPDDPTKFCDPGVPIVKAYEVKDADF